MENYEQKYKEALERARTIHNEHRAQCADVMVKVFPELRESEDERIRKEIIKYLKERARCGFNQEVRICNDGIAWLEKQGEQKFTDKVEPKFKVGDWIVKEYSDVSTANQVVEVKWLESDYFQYTLDDGTDFKGSSSSNSWESLFHLWTIQDAKDGDVLEFGDHGRLVVGIVSYVNKTTGKVDVNCLLENNNFKMGNYYNLDTIKPHPATKEQHELLFQKMKEAGYEWDAEKKELRKIEQKPVPITDEWIEDYWKHNKVNNPYSYDKGDEIQFDHDGFIRFCNKYFQKSAWSEEDERTYSEILDFFLGDIGTRCATIDKQRHFGYWLKSLKDRVQPQPKQEWSEDDSWMLNVCCNAIDSYKEPVDKYMVKNWLKSIKPNHWKPSQKQMEALNAINTVGEISYAGQENLLIELYNELKKF